MPDLKDLHLIHLWAKQPRDKDNLEGFGEELIAASPVFIRDLIVAVVVLLKRGP